jgi:hypothetical protein
MLACVGVVAGLVIGGAGPLRAAVADDGGRVAVQEPSFAGTGTPTGTKRSESIVWWNDRSWWADMWDTHSDDFHIFRFDLHSQRWVDTKTPVDRRANTHADVLWDGAHLYVASHRTTRDMQPAVPGPASYLYRFSYSRRERRYTLDRGFPAVINRYRTETLAIERDSTGKLWATWQQDGRIYLNRSLDAAGRTWGNPFPLPFSEARVSVDDISALVLYSGRLGIMWSNQQPESDGMWFSSHRDGSPDGVWTVPEPALEGGRAADDHINLKSDSRGTVYAAIKTSNIHSDPLTLLLVRNPGGEWSNSTYGRASDCNNRPVIVIDERRRLIRMFATGPSPSAVVCNSSGGAIYEKDAVIDSPAFPPGRGELILDDPNAPFIHNADVSKRNVPDAAGVLVLAVNEKTEQYWTLFESG